MTKQIILISLLITLATMALAVNPVRVEATSPSVMTLRFESPELEIQQDKTSDFHQITMASAVSTPETGSPDLPIFGTSIILPAQGSYSIETIVHSQTAYSGIKPLPVYDTDERSAFDPQKYYAVRSQPVVQPGEISMLRDFRILPLQINPTAWDAESQKLTVYEELEIRISFSGETTTTDLPQYSGYSPAFRNLYAANLLNFEDYRDLNTDQDYGRILMIYNHGVNSTYLGMVENFARWKRMKGHDVNLVSTQMTGTTNNAIKSYIQGRYDNLDTRPDYVILIGDTPQIPTFFESSYSGEGDYPYTFLAGNDLLGDVFIGRISVETVDQLATVLGKIYRYERDVSTNPDIAGWLDRMLLVGDPSTSGISCKYNTKYIKELAEVANPDYSFVEHYSGSAASTINSAINQGVSFMTYRGWIGMSGWSPGSSLMNGSRLPHAVLLTCSTGNFGGSYGTASTEAFIRLGTAANPSGAVTAIGMATSATNTMFNNALNVGIFDGIFTHGMRSMGEALLNARLFLYETYVATHSSKTNSHAHWCNLMGDPSMEVFVGIPRDLEIAAADGLPLGSTILDIFLTDDAGMPVSGASITAHSAASDQIVGRGYTAENGELSLYISSGIQSDLTITASKNDHKPTTHTVAVEAGGIVYYDKIIYDNGEHGSSGNGDGFASAGETVSMILSVKNTSEGVLSISEVSVSCDDDYVDLIDDSLSFGDIPVGAHLMADDAITFSINHDLPYMHDLRFEFSFLDGSGESHGFPFLLTIYNGKLEVETISIQAGGDDILDPTEIGTLNLGIRNSSVAGVNDISAELIALNDLVQVQESQAYVGSIPAGFLTNTMESFTVFARSLLIPGMQIPFRLRLTNPAGFVQDTFFNIPIGTVSQNTPLGPDSYGYFIYDESDTAFSDCPTYDWIEIDPSLGGSGTRLNTLYDPHTSNDEGDTQNSTTLEVVDLPFSFSFYGISYDQITVCTNGFIALGITEDAEFRNGRLPGGQGPSPMIAAFWDDLVLPSGGGIYQYHDAAGGLFIIEYSKMRNGLNNSSLETFQVIFHDPMAHPTSLGDGKIKIQYKDFNNVDNGSGGYTPRHGRYATIGIKDHTNTRGLEYTYNNVYPPTATQLSNQSALMITTVPVLHESPYLLVQDLIINDPNGNGIAEPGETIELGIRLVNQGLNTAEEAQITVSMDHPWAQMANSQSAYPPIPGDTGAVNIDAIGVSISEECPDDSVIQLSVNVENGVSQWTYPISFIVKKPAVTIKSFYMNDVQSNGNGSVDPGEDFKLAINFQNTGEVDANNLSVNIMSVSQYVTIADPGTSIPSLPAGEMAQVHYDISISENAPMGNNLSFYVSYLGDLVTAHSEQVMISVGTTGVFYDFEDYNGSMHPDPINNGWEWGSSTSHTAHSGVKLWATRLNSDYGSNANYTLSSQSIYIGDNFMLEFWHKYQTEAGVDGGNVKISTDGGSSWNLLTPEGGYPFSQVSALNAPGFSGQSPSWVRVRFPLADYANNNVKFRLSFASNGHTSDAGWFIDDLRTSGYLSFAGEVTGNISSSDPQINFSDIRVQNQDYINVYPTANGDYRIYLPMGSQLLKAIGEGYHSLDPVAIALSQQSPVAELDFYLGHFKPVSQPSHKVVDSLLTLSWDIPDDAQYQILAYEVFKRFGASLFEQVAKVTEPIYQEVLDIPGNYQYQIRVQYQEGYSRMSETLAFDWGGVSSDDPSVNPVISGLLGNYPNPFNPTTTIRFSLADPSESRLTVYNLRGQRVCLLADEMMSAGEHHKVWDGRDQTGRMVSSGIYLIRLQTKDGNFTQKAMLMK